MEKETEAQEIIRELKKYKKAYKIMMAICWDSLLYEDKEILNKKLKRLGL